MWNYHLRAQWGVLLEHVLNINRPECDEGGTRAVRMKNSVSDTIKFKVFGELICAFTGQSAPSFSVKGKQSFGVANVCVGDHLKSPVNHNHSSK